MADSKFGSSMVGGVLMSLLVCMGWGMYSSHTRFEVGDCTNFRFWHDLWCGGQGP